MQFDDALRQLTEARTAAAELETEFGARPQFDAIKDALRNFESVLREANDALAQLHGEPLHESN